MEPLCAPAQAPCGPADTMSTLAPLYLPTRPPHGFQARALGLAALALVAMALLALGTWQAIGWWQGTRAASALQPQVKLASVYVTRVLEYQFGEDSNITVGEFIQVTESGLAEMEKATIDIKAARRSHPQTADKAVAYLGESQELLRTLNRLARMQVKIDTYKEQVQQLDVQASSASTPAEQRAVREQLSAVLRSVIALLGEAQAQAESTARHLENLTAQQAWVRETFGEESTVPMGILQKASREVSKSLGGEREKQQGVEPAERDGQLSPGRVESAQRPAALVL